MKKIFVCSPLRGNVVLNLNRAIEHCRYVARCGHIPIAPHVYFTRFLNEDIEEERRMGIEMGIELMGDCQELWVFGEGVISGGMKEEIKEWKKTTKPIYFNK